jgi:hypothetical protein
VVPLRSEREPRETKSRPGRECSWEVRLLLLLVMLTLLSLCAPKELRESYRVLSFLVGPKC